MAIIDLQRRLVEVGRVRMGATDQAGGKRGRPIRLDNWRLTSRDKHRLEHAAHLYGGTVTSWDGHDGQYVLDTQTPELPIVLIPGQTITQWYELWSGGGCKRRCDGHTETLADQPCMCPAYDERSELAKDGKACKPTTRLNVLLPEVPGIGCWRLETHGYYAAVELAGTAALLEEATRRGALLPARLRIDQRTQVRNGKTSRFPVPVVDIDVRVPEVLQIVGHAPAPLDPPAGYTPLTTTSAQVTVGDGLAAVSREPSRPAMGRRTAEPVGARAALQPAPITVDADDDTPTVISDAQRRLLWATAREHNLDDDQVKQLVLTVTGQDSTKSISRDQLDRVLTAMREATK